uniref:Plac8 onzin related protein 2 n=1 Tax=Electrophorus electricus TaxID=8005 RepID=A0AAY5EQ63_ELEEL
IMAATVVVQQTTMMTGTKTTEWSSGLCQCCEDMDSCCYAYWCCPCFACSTTSEFGEAMCLPLIDILGPGLLAASGMAVSVRNKYEIRVRDVTHRPDIMISCFCIWCSWCQMHREIKHHNMPVTVISTQKNTLKYGGFNTSC